MYCIFIYVFIFYCNIGLCFNGNILFKMKELSDTYNFIYLLALEFNFLYPSTPLFKRDLKIVCWFKANLLLIYHYDTDFSKEIIWGNNRNKT